MTYVYDNAAAGQGTTAYVIDTGIYVEHNVFYPSDSFHIIYIFMYLSLTMK